MADPVNTDVGVAVACGLVAVSVSGPDTISEIVLLVLLLVDQMPTELVTVPLTPVVKIVSVDTGSPLIKWMIKRTPTGGAVGVGVAVVFTGTGVVVSTRGPVMVGTAYGGSKRPKRPQALHGCAHETTCFGAARIGSHRESTMLAIAVGSAV